MTEKNNDTDQIAESVSTAATAAGSFLSWVNRDYSAAHQAEYRGLRAAYALHEQPIPPLLAGNGNSPPQENIPSPDTYQVGYWQQQWHKGSSPGDFYEDAKNMITAVCQYECNKISRYFSGSKPQDPIHLFFHIFKNFLMELSFATYPIVSTDRMHQQVQSYLKILGTLERKNVFESAFYHGPGETRKAVLIYCTQTLTAVHEKAQLHLAHRSARERLHTLHCDNKNAAMHIFRFLSLVFTPFQMPVHWTLDDFRLAKEDSLPCFYTSEKCGIAARLQQLSLSEPMMALSPPQKAHAVNTVIPVSHTDFWNALQQPWHVPLLAGLKAQTGWSDSVTLPGHLYDSERLYGIYRDLHTHEDSFQDFDTLYHLCYQHIRLSQLISNLYDLSGEGGNILVYGVNYKRTRLLLQQHAQVLNQIVVPLERLSKTVQQLYENRGIANTGRQHAWRGQYEKMWHEKEMIDQTIEKLLEENKQMTDDLEKLSVRERVEQASHLMNCLKKQIHQYVIDYDSARIGELVECEQSPVRTCLKQEIQDPHLDIPDVSSSVESDNESTSLVRVRCIRNNTHNESRYEQDYGIRRRRGHVEETKLWMIKKENDSWLQEKKNMADVDLGRRFWGNARTLKGRAGDADNYRTHILFRLHYDTYGNPYDGINFPYSGNMIINHVQWQLYNGERVQRSRLDPNCHSCFFIPIDEETQKDVVNPFKNLILQTEGCHRQVQNWLNILSSERIDDLLKDTEPAPLRNQWIGANIRTMHALLEGVNLYFQIFLKQCFPVNSQIPLNRYNLLSPVIDYMQEACKSAQIVMTEWPLSENMTQRPTSFRPTVFKQNLLKLSESVLQAVAHYRVLPLIIKGSIQSIRKYGSGSSNHEYGYLPSSDLERVTVRTLNHILRQVNRYSVWDEESDMLVMISDTDCSKFIHFAADYRLVWRPAEDPDEKCSKKFNLLQRLHHLVMDENRLMNYDAVLSQGYEAAPAQVVAQPRF